VNNQLLGGMALAIATTFLLRLGKAKYIWVTMIPMTFLLVTTIVAGYQNIVNNYLPKHNYLLAVLSALMIIMVVLIVADSVRVWIRILSGKTPLIKETEEKAILKEAPTKYLSE